ncbi:MAG: hypothetical protein IH848_06920, partial [Acidobacteria bacterium]|nr:hypothetical protein [Acidobacteriota bacterium]
MKRLLAIGLLLALTGATPLVAGKLDVGDRVVVKFTAAGQLIVRDGLVIDGEAIFTSENDDANGGAIHPTAASPNPGDWMGVRLERSSPSSLTQFAGLRVLFAGNGVPAVALRDTSIALAGFSVEQAAGVGLGVTSQTSSALSQLVLTGNDVGLSVDAGATLSLSGAFIGGNTAFGALNLDPSNPLTISSTWWGHPSGPLDASDDTGTGGLFNPNGLGNAVSDGILYDPASQLIPLIGASIEPLDGSLAVQQDVTFRLRSLTAVAAKLNEDDTFPASTFETLTPTRVLTLSPGDGLKTVFARFQAATGNTQDVSTQLTLDVSAPNVIVTNPNPGDVIGRPITVTVQATDVTGVDRVDFLVDGVLVFSDTTNAFSFDWDVRPLTDGPHELSAIGIDTVGHAQRVDVAVIVSVLSPAPPVITSPATGSTLAKDTVAVSGTAEPQSTITVYVNVISAGQVLTDGTGNWSLAGVLLAEGVSTITATASDTGGISQPSGGVLVTVDTGPPGPPLFLTFLDLPGGVKRFDWVESLDFD